MEKSGLSESEFDLFVSLLITRVDIVPADEVKERLTEAKEVSPDPDDVQYFAIALKYNCAIWSNDERLKAQSKVSILNTENVAKLAGLV